MPGGADIGHGAPEAPPPPKSYGMRHPGCKTREKLRWWDVSVASQDVHSNTDSTKLSKLSPRHTYKWNSRAGCPWVKQRFAVARGEAGFEMSSGGTGSFPHFLVIFRRAFVSSGAKAIFKSRVNSLVFNGALKQDRSWRARLMETALLKIV